MNVLGAVLILVLLICVILVTIYNRLVALRNNRESAFADIEVQLTQRFDLVDNLVNTVKGYAKHEKDVLQKMVDARTGFMKAETVDQKLEANNQLSGALKTLFAVAEAYPDLKSNQNFLQLQTELGDIENKLAAARRYFNSTTKEYNTAIQSFPANIIAQSFGFQREKFFELENEAARKAPKVEF